MQYDVSVFSSGAKVKVVRLTADGAVQAIETIEAQYPAEELPWPVYDKNGKQIGTKMVAWTGYEFQAKEILPC